MVIYRASKITAAIYAVVCIPLLIAGSFGGEYAIGAQFWLMLAGLPSATLALTLADATMPALIFAATLGFVQWITLTQCMCWWKIKHASAYKST
jgi:hypothetical protein